MMEKTEQLFRMMDNPGQYTDEQWREILADEECASLYEVMCKTKSAIDAERVDRELSDEDVAREWERFEASHHTPAGKALSWRKAAVVAVILAFFGIAAAALYSHFAIATKSGIVENAVTQQNEQVNEMSEKAVDDDTEKLQPRLYDNVPLEQIIEELSALYNVQPEWHGHEVRSLRLYYKWEPDFTLDKVVEMLNNFESFSVLLDGDKLIITENDLTSNKK